MGKVSDLHQDLESIHQILLGQRKVATLNLQEAQNWTPLEVPTYMARIECIDDLLLEIEAAGVVWPDNVVELNTVTSPRKGLYTLEGIAKAYGWNVDKTPTICDCGGDIHPEHGPNC